MKRLSVTATQRGVRHRVTAVAPGVLLATTAAAAGSVLPVTAAAQASAFVPVTQAMLESPDPADWLMFSRTYDAQRYSPLDEIDTGNVGRLSLAWTHVFGEGTTETVPLVYDGVLYVVAPGAVVAAFDAANGDSIWTYTHDVPDGVARGARTKNLAIYDDVIVYTAPDSLVVCLDATTGHVRWQTRTDSRAHTSGPIVVDGLAISGGACFGDRDNCYLAAHDVATGVEVWRFYTTPAPGEPGDDSWNGAPLENRQASTWGFPGSYDAERGLVYWGIANPMPDHRAARHGDPDGTARTTPADLYSNSTVALDPATGELVWYYQHLPGDDWDLDATHERTLVTTQIEPDPRYAKWINPNVATGEPRDVAVTITEGGGLFVLDRDDGTFLWGTPFPFDTPEFGIADIDGATGRVAINWDLVFKNPGEQKIVCYWNTRSYWPTAYHPGTNSLYTSYIDNCREITAAGGEDRGGWRVVPRPGTDPDALTGIAKIDLATGETLRFNTGRAPGNGALLATGGGLIFHGDMSRRFRAFDATSGEPLWETILGGNVSVSTISYAAAGKQYIAVMTGDNLKVPELLGVVPELKAPPVHNASYVFALPD
ncbi:MAG: PQQ-binding-like beta-propeller repeat protein [Gammaproteobacteria bacterium]|nr:PQQ-binding-like beta-propeller repeat protein [Gammaproteobacteria bacterium]